MVKMSNQQQVTVFDSKMTRRKTDNRRALQFNRQQQEYTRKVIEKRSKTLTLILFSLIASISCLTPFVSLHLTQRVGMLLFESDLLQFRSSLYSVIICFFVLIIIFTIVKILSKRKTFNNTNMKSKSYQLILQKVLKQSIILFSTLSAISYLSIVLIVPQIKQIQRMPIATFDCDANLITIENCHQQFQHTSRGGEQTLSEALYLLFWKDFLNFNTNNDNNNNNNNLGRETNNNRNLNDERLIKKLNCLKYNEKELKRLETPTRFLLHNCGLICKPQKQQLHQFSDDLNKEQQQQDWASTAASATTTTTEKSIDFQEKHRLFAPYDDVDNHHHITYYNNSNVGAHLSDTRHNKEDIYDNLEQQDNNNDNSHNQVSLKVCFSNEFNGGGSNYKQFCITNLNSNSRLNKHEQPLTVGQLNAMLRKFVNPSSTSSIRNSNSPDDAIVFDNANLTENNFENDNDNYRNSFNNNNSNNNNNYDRIDNDDRTTHYVNPVVQFESHFKNWPHLSTKPLTSNLEQSNYLFNYYNIRDNNDESWCKFKPIPPFIVNNKPFSDIQCSLEHEYTMTTGSSSPSGSIRDNIYLKRSSAQSTQNSYNNDNNNFRDSIRTTTTTAKERCNIQCKLNILYQVHITTSTNTASTDKRTTSRKHSINNRREFASSSFKDFDDNNEENNLKIESKQHYYLPLKPCLIVTDGGDKSKTALYYLIFRSIGDSTLLLTFISIDILLLLESIDTKKAQFEGRKFRLIGLLLIITIIPLIVGLIFDLTALYSPYNGNNLSDKIKKDGILVSLFYEHFVPNLIELFSKTTTSTSKRITPSSLRYDNNSTTIDSITKTKVPTISFVIDNYMLPFFIYSICMFTMAINSLSLPTVNSSAPLIRVSSTEELGLAKVSSTSSLKATGNANNEGACFDGAPQTSGFGRITNFDIDKKSTTKSYQFNRQKQVNNNNNTSQQVELFKKQLNDSNRKQAFNMISFLLITLFMGLQFNLSQISQTQIFTETFGNPSHHQQSLNFNSQDINNNSNEIRDNNDYTNYRALIYVFKTHSSAILIILIIALLLVNETFVFFNEFSPFKSSSVSDERKENRAKFLKHQSISLLIYSIRFYGLSSLTQLKQKQLQQQFFIYNQFDLNWLVVLLFQLGELFNFPLVWFSLSTRVHEIIAEHPLYKRPTFSIMKSISSTSIDNNKTCNVVGNENYNTDNTKREEVDPEMEEARKLKLFEAHVFVQTLLAFVYFVLGRPLALFVHSLHASLHLHSDNVDWFITSFYSTETHQTPGTSSPTFANRNNFTQNHHHFNPSNSTSSASNDNSSTTTSLFSPLPGERQTYLHSSRLFLKYNSIICLLIGLTLLVGFVYVKYQLWNEQKRTLNVFHGPFRRKNNNHKSSRRQNDNNVDKSNSKRSRLIMKKPSFNKLKQASNIGIQAFGSDFKRDKMTNTNDYSSASGDYKVSRQKLTDDDSESLDPLEERLKQDLLKLNVPLHRQSFNNYDNNTRLIYPRTIDNKQIQDSDSVMLDSSDRSHSPRAKILFHYNLDRRKGRAGERKQSLSNESSDSVTSLADPTGQQQQQQQLESNKSSLGVHDEHRIPIPFGADDEDVVVVSDEQQSEQSSSIVEKIIRNRNKRVRIFEDDENWADNQFFEDGTNTNNNEELGLILKEQSGESERRKKQQQQLHTSRPKKRTISFAPTTTLIGGTSSSSASNSNSSHYTGRNTNVDASSHNNSYNDYVREDKFIVRKGSRNLHLEPQANDRLVGMSRTRIIPIHRASPEPSIDGDDDNDEENYHEKHEHDDSIDNNSDY